MTTDKHNKRPNVPPLRFPEFTEPWETAKLGDMTVNFSKRNKDEIEYPMYSVTNNRGFIPQSEQFEDREMVSSDIKSYKIIAKGDFAYNPARINVGSIAKYNGDNDCMISSLYVAFRAKEQINAEWLMQLLKTPKMNFYYNLNAEGGVRMYLFYPNFERIRTSYPSLNEQRKVAQFLDLLDHRIAVQSGLINKLESLISGIGQRVFLHFNSFEKLGNVAKITNGNSDVQDAIEIYESGLYPFYDRSDVIKYLNTYYLDKEAIIYAGEGSEFFPRYHNGKFALHQRCYAIFDFKEEYLPKFIYYYMFTLNGYFVRNSVGSTVPSLRMGTFEKVNIPKVPVKQQLYIIKVFDCLHKKLHQAKQTKRLFEMQKQYLLQQMFI